MGYASDTDAYKFPLCIRTHLRLHFEKLMINFCNGSYTSVPNANKSNYTLLQKKNILFKKKFLEIFFSITVAPEHKRFYLVVWMQVALRKFWRDSIHKWDCPVPPDLNILINSKSNNLHLIQNCQNNTHQLLRAFQLLQMCLY